MIPGGIPTSERRLISQVNEWKETCRVSVGARSSYYRLLNAIAETGRYDGQKSLINTLNKQLERVAANLYSPTSLKFDIVPQILGICLCYVLSESITDLPLTPKYE